MGREGEAGSSLFPLRRAASCVLRSQEAAGAELEGPLGEAGLLGGRGRCPQAAGCALRPGRREGALTPFLGATGRLAPWVSCLRWKAVLETSPEYVMVFAHAERGPRLQGMRFIYFLFFRAVNPNSRLGNYLPAPETVACGSETELA